jgi:hypothetical protein
MARDGYRDFTLDEIGREAQQAIKELDGRNGDPSRRANWIRERRFAWALHTLVERIKDAARGLEIKP